MTCPFSIIPYIMVEPKQWSEMIEAIEENVRLKAEVERLKSDNQRVGEELLQIRLDVMQDPVLREAIKDAVMNTRKL